MNKNLGMNFNIAVVFDEDSNVSIGMNYNDSTGLEISTQVESDDVTEAVDALMVSFIEDYINATTKQEPEPMSELDQLKLEIQKLQEENARLEYRLQHMVEQPEEKESSKVSEKDVEEALKYVDDLLELFNALYK